MTGCAPCQSPFLRVPPIALRRKIGMLSKGAFFSRNHERSRHDRQERTATPDTVQAALRTKEVIVGRVRHVLCRAHVTRLTARRGGWSDPPRRIDALDVHRLAERPRTAR